MIHHIVILLAWCSSSQQSVSLWRIKHLLQHTSLPLFYTSEAVAVIFCQFQVKLQGHQQAWPSRPKADKQLGGPVAALYPCLGYWKVPQREGKMCCFASKCWVRRFVIIRLCYQKKNGNTSVSTLAFFAIFIWKSSNTNPTPGFFSCLPYRTWP